MQYWPKFTEWVDRWPPWAQALRYSLLIPLYWLFLVVLFFGGALPFWLLDCLAPRCSRYLEAFGRDIWLCMGLWLCRGRPFSFLSR